MTDILIRGMEMPKCCGQCPIEVYEGRAIPYCPRSTETDWSTYAIREVGRRADCPLVELPPHGDLIDRDAFEADASKRYCAGCDNYNGGRCRACWVDDMLGDLTDFAIVIPAERSEE